MPVINTFVCIYVNYEKQVQFVAMVLQEINCQQIKYKQARNTSLALQAFYTQPTSESIETIWAHRMLLLSITQLYILMYK